MAVRRDPLLLYAYVAEWEYACCEAEPDVGDEVEWALEAMPAEPGDPAAVSGLSWDDELNLVRFHGGSAGRSALHAEHRGPVSLYATWHAADPAVAVAGAVAEVLPDEDGVVVGLRVRTITEPTREQADEARARRDRDARTIGLTGPSAAFTAAGTDIPAVGDRMAIDLADPRVSQTGRGRRSGVVYGVIRQVSRAERTPSGGHFFHDLDPDGPTPAELFIALVCDE